MRHLPLSCLAILASALALTAHAAPITITETFTGNGSFNGTAFTDQTVTFGGTGNTTNVSFGAGGFEELATTSNFLQIGSGPHLQLHEQSARSLRLRGNKRLRWLLRHRPNGHRRCHERTILPLRTQYVH